MKNIFIKTMAVSVIFSLFTGCTLPSKVQKRNVEQKQWDQLFDGKGWEPVNIESGKKEIL